MGQPRVPVTKVMTTQPLSLLPRPEILVSQRGQVHTLGSGPEFKSCAIVWHSSCFYPDCRPVPASNHHPQRPKQQRTGKGVQRGRARHKRSRREHGKKPHAPNTTEGEVLHLKRRGTGTLDWTKGTRPNTSPQPAATEDAIDIPSRTRE